jgi:hypothetical protein
MTPRESEASLLQRGGSLRAARLLVQYVANEQLDAHASARVLLDKETGKQNLLGALWVQVSETIDKGGLSKRCATCRKWIVIFGQAARTGALRVLVEA